MKQVYLDRKTYTKFDDNHYLLYLNEEVIPDYIPDNHIGEEVPEPRIGYAYSGTELDGGTLILAESPSYADFVSGLIRLKYNSDAESAIQANMIVALSQPDNSRTIEFKEEWDEYQIYREECKSQAKLVIE